MNRRTTLLALCACFTLVVAGCGGTDDTPDTGPVDAGGADQGQASCAVNNGGCSTAPLVACGTSADGAVLCAACPAGYTGDGRVCTSVAPIDECALHTDNCAPTAICTDTPTAFLCTCPTGFTGDGLSCVHQGCVSASDCDDGVACTVDTCSESGSCLHTADNGLCEANGTCHPTAGCVTGRVCGSAADCVDSDPCTRNERCDIATATCTFSLLDSDQDGELPLVCGGTDCNDALSSVGAGASELCGNEVDDDCDGVIDADATIASNPLVLLNSEQHCGACGNVCAPGQSCYLGECVACGAAAGAPCCGTFCTSLSTCGGGTCTNGGGCEVSGAAATCTAPCGSLGEACCGGAQCDPGGVCSEGLCVDATMITCADAGAPLLYRLNMLSVPTPALASSGAVVGHNLDGVGERCTVPDYTGGIDNSLIDLVAALPALSPDDPFDLQAEIDNALVCPSSGSTCTRLDLIVSMAVGTGCATMEILDGTGPGATTLAGPFGVTLDGSGAFHGQASSFALSVPVVLDSDVAYVMLNLSGFFISGVYSPSALTDLVLGGTLVQADFETTIMNLLPWFGGAIEFNDIAGILANLYDMEVDGQCRGLSAGFRASGVAL